MQQVVYINLINTYLNNVLHKSLSVTEVLKEIIVHCCE